MVKEEFSEYCINAMGFLGQGRAISETPKETPKELVAFSYDTNIGRFRQVPACWSRDFEDPRLTNLSGFVYCVNPIGSEIIITTDGRRLSGN